MVMLGTDMKVAEMPTDGLKDYSKSDPYTDWLKKEGVKVYQEFYFPSLARIELGPWERKGGSGCSGVVDFGRTAAASKRHRRAGVEDDLRGEVSGFPILLRVQPIRACEKFPVDVLEIVSRTIVPVLAELSAVAVKRAVVQAGQKAFNDELGAEIEPGNSLNDFRAQVLLGGRHGGIVAEVAQNFPPGGHYSSIGERPVSAGW